MIFPPPLYGISLIQGGLQRDLNPGVCQFQCRPRKKQAVQVINPGKCTHCGSGVRLDPRLFNRESWPQPANLFKVGLVLHADPGACISREIAQEAVPGFGMNGIKSKGRLSAAGNTGDHC